MKRTLVLVLICVISFTFAVLASGDVAVKIDGEEISFDVPPMIVDGRTLVPMRKIYETLGAKVEWVGEAQLIVAAKDNYIFTMEIGKTNMAKTDVITGESVNITLDVPPMIVDSGTLVPARAVSEALDMNVDWDDVTRTVLITKKTQ